MWLLVVVMFAVGTMDLKATHHDTFAATNTEDECVKALTEAAPKLDEGVKQGKIGGYILKCVEMTKVLPK